MHSIFDTIPGIPYDEFRKKRLGMTKYPEYANLDTDDEVIEALLEIAKNEGVDFMQLWACGCTKDKSTNEIDELVIAHIRQVQENTEDLYAWEDEVIWMD